MPSTDNGVLGTFSAAGYSRPIYAAYYTDFKKVCFPTCNASPYK
jgi:hypothetical protein